MIVNEDSSQLALYGSFGSTSGFVAVDGDTLSNVQWSDTTLIASIPDTGVASAGPVVVTTHSGTSDTALLSSMSGSFTNGVGPSGKSEVFFHNEQTLVFSVRFDLNRILKASPRHLFLL